MLQETIRSEQPLGVCRTDSGWRSQFGHPRGWRGWAMGHLMAVTNKERSLWVLSLLNLQPEDHVLEIGFGPGADIHRAAERVALGFVAGIDSSDVMLRQAMRKNREAIRAGRVELRQGTASHLPYESASVDVVFATNVAQHWGDPTGPLREIFRVLKPGGLAALAVQPRNKGASEQTAEQTGQILTDALFSAGFKSVRLERRPMKPVSTVCALGIR